MSDNALTYAEAKSRLEAMWPDGVLQRCSDDPAERIPMLTVERALAVLFPSAKALTCDMRDDCTEPVTMIDENGFAYCTDHGMDRRSWKRCRKLRPWELRKLQRGEQLARY